MTCTPPPRRSGFFARLKAWWRRKVTVEQAHPDFDVLRVRIDPADGTAPQEMLLSRHNAFSMAWVCREVRAQEAARGKRLHSVTLTLEDPQPDGEVQLRTLSVPDWARRALYAQIEQRAIALGWKGECPRPAKHGAYR
jgi:hypothetical protein